MAQITITMSDAEAEALYAFAVYGETEYQDGDLPMNRHSFKAGGRGLYKLGSALRESREVSGAEVCEP